MSNRRARSWMPWPSTALALLGLSMCAWAYTQSTTNPRYLEIKGQPILPLSSEEHYGSVVNKCFDYPKYLDSMAAYDQTMTQIYPGGWYTEGDALAATGCGDGQPGGPMGDNCVLPWVKTGTKFDLDTWNSAYFTRVHDFMNRCRDRGIMVMVALANGMYAGSWGHPEISPLYGPHTIQNNTGTPAACDFQYMNNANLFGYQVKYIKKMMYELNSYDNLEYYLIDEPGAAGCNDNRISTWISALIDTMYSYEGTLPQRHALSVDGAWGATRAQSDNPHISGQQDMGQWYADPDRRNRYTFANEIGINAGTQHMGDFWGNLFQGAASVQHLSFNWSGSGYLWVGSEGGSPNQRAVWRGIQALSRFINSVNFVKMTRNRDIEVSPGWAGLSGQMNGAVGAMALGDSTNHEYAIYRNRDGCTSGSCNPAAAASENITMRFPAGDYKYEWVNVLDASVMGSGTFTASGSNTVLTTPAYQMGIALRIKQTHQTPTIPHIRLPWSGRTGMATNPTVTWWGVWDATSVHCQVSANPDMSSPIVNDSSLGGTAVSKSLGGLTGNTTYYWRVRSKNINGVSAWSPIWRFGTGGTTGAIQRSVSDGHVRSGFTARAARRSITVSGSAGSAVAVYDAKGRRLVRAFSGTGQIAIPTAYSGIVFVREENSGSRATAVLQR